ncbi:hypothetical protein B0H16DRAFT_1534229 [Mycena metata]|uniref:Uncharacterized protein n=1 Tax=Mycena metata TaxID=1033252 RepID=A0AAD7NFV7_9AGAR|nr:hypothetical protein B0H16DRAFT_1534229 [Mycena metata]
MCSWMCLLRGSWVSSPRRICTLLSLRTSLSHPPCLQILDLSAATRCCESRLEHGKRMHCATLRRGAGAYSVSSRVVRSPSSVASRR